MSSTRRTKGNKCSSQSTATPYTRPETALSPRHAAEQEPLEIPDFDDLDPDYDMNVSSGDIAVFNDQLNMLTRWAFTLKDVLQPKTTYFKTQYSFTHPVMDFRATLTDCINMIDTLLPQLGRPEYSIDCTKVCPLNKEHFDKETTTIDLPIDPPTPIVNITPNPDDMHVDTPRPRPTYAEAAVSARLSDDKPKPGPNPRHLASFKIPPSSRPKAQPIKAPVMNPVQLVVRLLQPTPSTMPFARVLIRGPSKPYRLLHHSLSLAPSTSGVVLLGVHQNRSGNLIVSLPHGTSDAHVDAITTVIHSVYTPLVNAPLTVSRDVRWTKLMVSGVPTRLNTGDSTYSEEQVKTSFLLNPSISNLSIMRNPRWIRNPASITGPHSSFTFSFQDPDGTLGRSLAKSRLFMFGEPVHLKRWTNKPLPSCGTNST